MKDEEGHLAGSAGARNSRPWSCELEPHVGYSRYLKKKKRQRNYTYVCVDLRHLGMGEEEMRKDHMKLLIVFLAEYEPARR